MQDQKPIAIAELYPDFTKEELGVAEMNLRQYLAVLLRISESRSINDLVDGRFDDCEKQL